MREDIMREMFKPLLEPDWKEIQEDIAVKAYLEEKAESRAHKKVIAVKVEK